MRRRTTLLYPALFFALLAAACGDRPERLEKGAAPAPAAHPAAAEPRFAGKVFLEGSTEGATGAAVFLSARRVGQRLPSLSRKYELSDPAWKQEGERRVLEFKLTDLDNMGGFGAPMAAEMEVEARYDPDGMIDPTPGAVDPGVVKAAVPASPGAKTLEIQLRIAAAK